MDKIEKKGVQKYTALYMSLGMCFGIPIGNAIGMMIGSAKDKKLSGVFRK